MSTTNFTSKQQGCEHVCWARLLSASGGNPRRPGPYLHMRKPSLPFSFQACVMRYRPSYVFSLHANKPSLSAQSHRSGKSKIGAMPWHACLTGRCLRCSMRQGQPGAICLTSMTRQPSQQHMPIMRSCNQEGCMSYHQAAITAAYADHAQLQSGRVYELSPGSHHSSIHMSSLQPCNREGCMSNSQAGAPADTHGRAPLESELQGQVALRPLLVLHLEGAAHSSIQTRTTSSAAACLHACTAPMHNTLEASVCSKASKRRIRPFSRVSCNSLSPCASSLAPTSGSSRRG